MGAQGEWVNVKMRLLNDANFGRDASTTASGYDPYGFISPRRYGPPAMQAPWYWRPYRSVYLN